MMRLKRAVVAGLLTVQLSASIAVQGQDFWQPSLLNDTTAAIPADATLRFLLPAEMPEDTLQWLALELDNFDISELVRLE